jgi:hypothetical protein
VALQDEPEQQRAGFGLWQVTLTLVTILVTAWLCTLGWVAAVLSLMVAKHILVAILASGLGVDGGRRIRA